MNIRDVLENLDEEERLRYLSAIEVKKSAFWKYLIEELDELAEINKGELLGQTMKGNSKEALIAACKIQALHFAKEKMETIMSEIEYLALNQEQEEKDA